MSKVLVVTAISEVKEDSNGRDYKTIGVTKVEHKVMINPITGKKSVALGNKRVSAFNAYEENYLGNMDLGWESKVYDVLLGDMVTKNVTPYEIESESGVRTVNTATCIVIGDTEDKAAFNKATLSAFKSSAFVAKDEPLRFEILEGNEVEEEEFDIA